MYYSDRHAVAGTSADEQCYCFDHDDCVQSTKSDGYSSHIYRLSCFEGGPTCDWSLDNTNHFCNGFGNNYPMPDAAGSASSCQSACGNQGFGVTMYYSDRHAVAGTNADEQCYCFNAADCTDSYENDGYSSHIYRLSCDEASSAITFVEVPGKALSILQGAAFLVCAFVTGVAVTFAAMRTKHAIPADNYHQVAA
jgi:hypothetical protein